MNTHPIGEPGKMRSAARDLRTTALRQMTPEQLLHLGTRQVVYLVYRMMRPKPDRQPHKSKGCSYA